MSYSFVIPAFEPVSSKYGLLVKPGMTLIGCGNDMRSARGGGEAMQHTYMCSRASRRPMHAALVRWHSQVHARPDVHGPLLIGG